MRALRSAQVMLLVFTSNANNSDEIKKELVLAGRHRVTVVPIRVEDVVPNDAFTYEFATRQWIDLFKDWEREIELLGEQARPRFGKCKTAGWRRRGNARGRASVNACCQTVVEPAAGPGRGAGCGPDHRRRRRSLHADICADRAAGANACRADGCANTAARTGPPAAVASSPPAPTVAPPEPPAAAPALSPTKLHGRPPRPQARSRRSATTKRTFRPAFTPRPRNCVCST